MLSIMSCNFVPALLKICCSFAEVALWTLCRGHLIIITVFFFRIFFSEGIKSDHFNLFAKRLKSNRPMQLNRKSGEYCIGMLPVFWMVINWWQKCLVAMTVIKVCLSQLINFVLRCIYLLFLILNWIVSADFDLDFAFMLISKPSSTKPCVKSVPDIAGRKV